MAPAAMARAAAASARVAILTRPEGRNEALAHRLQAAGFIARALPALDILPLAPSAAVPRPQDYGLVVFVSGAAARHYFDQLARAHGMGAWPSVVPAATVGPASAEALRESGWFGANTTVLHPGAEAPSHDSEALWELLRGRPLPARVLLVRGTRGRDWLGDTLAAQGVAVDRHAAYERRPAAWAAADVAQLRRWAEAGTPVTWLVTSGEGIDAIRANLDAAGLGAWWERCGFVATHPALARRLPRHGTGAAPMVQICMPNDESIFQAFVAA